MFKINRLIKLITPFLFVLLITTSFKSYSPNISETVSVWLTTANQTNKLTPQTSLSFAPDAGSIPLTITLDESSTYQIAAGFGYTLTQGSAEVISGLAATQQNDLLNDIYHPTSGISSSFIRIAIGSSDLSSSVYTYNQTSGDVNMTNFSLNGPDMTYLIPILKKILVINPNIKILAVPWTAPLWMKSNNNSVGGSLLVANYAAYANYFVKYIQAMKAQGINIWAITPQNEPGNSNNNPSMLMTSAQQITFLNSNLGPALTAANLTTKIIVYDHNCDNTAYPIAVLNGSTYASGAGFHLYSGDIGALTTVHTATNKDVYFTEQYTAAAGDFGGDLKWHVQNVVIGASRNWAKTVIEWNLANNSAYGPHTNGGCTDCKGAITINNSTTYTRNVAYYIIGHISKVVQDGAVRIWSNNSGAIQNVTFKNPDGSFAMVALNTGNSSNTFKVKWGTQSFSYTLSAGAVASFKWMPTTTVPVKLTSFDVAKQSDISAIIKFQTASEIGNDHFVVERSTDGINFTTIAKLYSKGDEVTGATYSFVDQKPNIGTNFYRLRQIDKDGKSTYGEIRKIIFDNKPTLSLVVDMLNKNRSIQLLSAKEQLALFKVFDASGKLVYNNNIKTNSKVYLSSLVSGIYIYHITTNDENKIGKFMISR
ncbi:MAG: glycoside hydrolase family 30 beta sandwich domain-containing protein [Bacteroidota bacterium]